MFHTTRTHTPLHHAKHVDVNTSCMKMQELQTSSHRLQLPALLSVYFSISVLCVFLFVGCFFSLLPASCFKTKAESCSRCVALAKYYVTCWLNTFQEEPLKLKIFLWTVNVSMDYCNRIINMWQMNNLELILCTHKCMAFFFLHRSHLFLKRSFWNCKCLRCLPELFPFSCFFPPTLLCSSPPFSLWLFPPFGL